MGSFFSFKQSGLGSQIWAAIKAGNKEELARLLNGGVDPNVFRYERMVRIVEYIVVNFMVCDVAWSARISDK